MKDVSIRFNGAALLSLLIAFGLTIIPISEEWQLWRPEWLALTLIHWGLVSPRKSSLFLAWFIGLLLDVVHGTVLGQYAFGFLLVLFITLRMRPRILVDSLFQQLFLLFLALGSYLLINLWILGITGNTPSSGWSYWITVISSLVVWPLYHYYMHVFHAKKKPFE